MAIHEQKQSRFKCPCCRQFKYAVRRSSTLHAETLCPTPATTMHTPLCPIISIFFFTPRKTRLGTSSSASPHHTCITSTGNTVVTDTSLRSGFVQNHVTTGCTLSLFSAIYTKIPSRQVWSVRSGSMNFPRGMNILAEQTSSHCAMSMSYLAESV